MTFFSSFLFFFLMGGKGGGNPQPQSHGFGFFRQVRSLSRYVKIYHKKKSILQARLLTCAQSSMLSLWDLRADKARVRESFSG